MRRLWAALAVAAAMLHVGEAAADKFDETFDLALTQALAWYQTDDLALAPAVGAEPGAQFVEARPRLDGSGSASITRVRALLSLDGLRFGAGLGFLSASGSALRHGDLSGDATLDAGLLWGIPIEGFIAYAHGPAREVRPYLELHGGLTIVQTTLTSSSANADQLAAHDFAAYLPTMGARSGALVPLNEYFTLDVALSYAVVGPERLSLWCGLLLPIPLANL